MSIGHIGDLGRLRLTHNKSGPDVRAFRDFTAALQEGTSDLSLLWLGTSLSNSYVGWTGSYDEHVALLAKAFAAAYPTYAVGSLLWTATDSGSVGTWKTQAAIDGVTAGASLFSDNFNRADGAVGTSSGGGAYNTSTSWAISGNKVVCSSASNLLNPSVTPSSADMIVEVDYIHGTDTTTSNGCRIYGRYTSLTNSVYFGIKHNGAFDLVYASGAVNLASISIGRSLVSGDAVHIKLTVRGRFARGDATIAGVTYTVAGYLSSAQHAALTGTKWAVSFPGSVYTGKSLDNLTVNAVSQTRTLTIYNASVPGASIAYTRTNLAGISAGVEASPDLIVADTGYNEGSADVSAYWGRLDALRADLASSYPSSPVGLFMEMPVLPDAPNYTYHGPRALSLPTYCRAAGLSWIDAWNGYDTAWTNPGDYIHPLQTGTTWIAGRDADAFGVA